MGLARLACLGLFGTVTLSSSGCANQESVQAKAAVADRILCASGDIEAGVHRETPQVREWYVGCDFVYARVHCGAEGCRPAPVQPPCIGDLPCFEEDPVTLEWSLPEAPSRSTPVPVQRPRT
jgi:hypothetical protein